MPLPRSDPFRRERPGGLPARGVRGVKLAEGDIDAGKVRGTDVSTTAPVEGQTLVMRAGTLTPEATPGSATKYAVHYVFAPDAAPGDAITASTTNPQGILHHSGPAGEIATKMWVDAETAPGTNAVLKVKYADQDTLDGTPTWTEIATLTLTSKGINTTNMTTATIPADRLIGFFVDSISGTGAKDVSVTLRVKRPPIS